MFCVYLQDKNYVSAHYSFKIRTFLGFTTKILSALFVSCIFATFPNTLVSLV